MLKNSNPAPRAVLVQYRVLLCAHTRAALVRIRPLRWDVMRHATTWAQSWGWTRIMNDAVLVCIRKMSARIRELRSAPASDAAHHSLSHWYNFSASLQAVDTTAFHCRVNVPVGRAITFTGAGRNYLRQN